MTTHVSSGPKNPREGGLGVECYGNTRVLFVLCMYVCTSSSSSSRVLGGFRKTGNLDGRVTTTSRVTGNTRGLSVITTGNREVVA